MKPEVDWESRFRAEATGWERDHLNPAFNEWRARFEASAGTVIVPGCGRSPELKAFADMGWHVTGVDIAETAVAFQREQLLALGEGADPRAAVHQANVLEWQPEAAVDLVYEQTCLCALNPQLWPRYEEQLHRWLKPGGILAALFMQTSREGGPPYHCDLTAMAELFSEDRWSWDVQSLHSEHPAGIHELGYQLRRKP
ncbi:MAG: methyltransferase domain-containing protein [Halieaceae bacterium]|nr:methyltransferase domain-containing protein [Halieaceae bacterium]